MITDEIGRHKVLAVTKLIIKNCIFQRWMKNKHRCCFMFYELLLLKIFLKKTLNFGLVTVSQKLVAAILCKYFLVAYWSGSQELGLWLVYSTSLIDEFTATGYGKLSRDLNESFRFEEIVICIITEKPYQLWRSGGTWLHESNNGRFKRPRFSYVTFPPPVLVHLILIWIFFTRPLFCKSYCAWQTIFLICIGTNLAFSGL